MSIDDVTAGRRLTAEDLDLAVEDVRRLQRESLAQYFACAQRIREMYAAQLWKLRRLEDGLQAYTSWDAFVRAELSMSPKSSYEMIDVATHYGSADEIGEVGGRTNAVLILKAAPPHRERIAERARAGASSRDVAHEVAASRQQRGAPKQSQHATAGARSAVKKKSASSAKTAREKITVSSIEGSRTVRLYKRPEQTGSAVEWPPRERATKASDKPFGRLELQPGVVQYLAVLRKDGELVLNIQTVREAP